MDASRDEGAHPSGSHRIGQALTRIRPISLGSPASQSAGSILNASRSVLPISYIRFSFEQAWFGKRRVRLSEWYYPRINHDDAMVGVQPTRNAVWSGREDLNLRHPAPKADLGRNTRP
jgi:hypothetical protein